MQLIIFLCRKQMDNPEILLRHALDMYKHVQPYGILPKKAYKIIRELDEKTDTKTKAESLQALQTMIRKEGEKIDQTPQSRMIRDEITDPELRLQQLRREALEIPTKSQLLSEMGLHIPDSFEGDIRKDWVKLLNLVRKHSLELSESSDNILKIMGSTDKLTREDLDKLLQDANDQRAKKIRRKRMSLPWGEDEDGKYVWYNKRRVYLEPKKTE
jgi:hypothetical protein